MALIDNLKKVAFTTKYPADKIVDTIRGSFNVANNGTGSTSPSHTHERQLPSEMVYSVDNVNFYPSGVRIPFGANGYVICTQEVTSTNVRIFAENYQSGATRTIYYKVALIWNN